MPIKTSSFIHARQDFISLGYWQDLRWISKREAVPESKFLFYGWEKPNKQYYWIILIFESIPCLILHSGQVFNIPPFLELSLLQTRPQLSQTADLNVFEIRLPCSVISVISISRILEAFLNQPNPIKCRVFSSQELRVEGSMSKDNCPLTDSFVFLFVFGFDSPDLTWDITFGIND